MRLPFQPYISSQTWTKPRCWRSYCLSFTLSHWKLWLHTKSFIVVGDFEIFSFQAFLHNVSARAFSNPHDGVKFKSAYEAELIAFCRRRRMRNGCVHPRRGHKPWRVQPSAGTLAASEVCATLGGDKQKAMHPNRKPSQTLTLSLRAPCGLK